MHGLQASSTSSAHGALSALHAPCMVGPFVAICPNLGPLNECGICVLSTVRSEAPWRVRGNPGQTGVGAAWPLAHARWCVHWTLEAYTVYGRARLATV